MKCVYSLKFEGNDLQMNYPLRKAGYKGVGGIVMLLIGLTFLFVSGELILTPLGSDDVLSALFIEISFLFIGLILTAFGIVFLTCHRQLHFSASGIIIRITGIIKFNVKSIPIDRIKGLHIEVHKDAQYPDMVQDGIDYKESYSLHVLTTKGWGSVSIFGRFDLKSEAEDLEKQIARTLLLTKST
jgi:hypothetical protein